MSDDWRDIPMRVINWKHVHSHLGIVAHKLRRLSLPPIDDRAPRPYGTGCWSGLTLWQVADLTEPAGVVKETRARPAT